VAGASGAAAMGPPSPNNGACSVVGSGPSCLGLHMVSYRVCVSRLLECCPAAHICHGRLHCSGMGVLVAHLPHASDLTHGGGPAAGRSGGICGQAGREANGQARSGTED
jgi:hypothetical protein